MAKTISQLPDATSVADGDELIVQQSGVTKRASKLEVIAGIKDASIASDAAIAGSKLEDNAITTAKILDANVTPAKLSQPLTLATAQATTSGTSVEFTGIPSWVKRITMTLGGVSTSGSSVVIVQVGDGAYKTSGYSGTGANATAAVSPSASSRTAGFGIDNSANAASVRHGIIIIAHAGGNAWSSMAITGRDDGDNTVGLAAGSVSLSGALDRIRLTTAGGTDTFDAGSVNIMYEG